MKARNRNPHARKGPLKVTVHADSWNLLQRLIEDNQRSAEDLIALALNCLVGYLYRMKENTSIYQKPAQKRRGPVRIGRTVTKIVGNVRERTK